MRFVVVGGGIAGVAAAQRLVRCRPDAEVVLIEAAGCLGGKLRSVEVAGSRVDVGAEAMLVRRPEGLALVSEIGLQSELIYPLTTSALLRNRGTNRALPARTLMGIPTDLATLQAADVVSAHTISRISAEPDDGPYPPLEHDISVGDLVANRFGQEVVDRLVDPLLGGVYAGRANAISVNAAIPALARTLMAEGGSLFNAAAATVAAGARDVAGSPVFASLIGGLARLPDAVAEGGGFTVRLQTTVGAIRRSDSGFLLTLGPTSDPEQIRADGVIVACPAGKAASLLADVAPVASRELAQIETASMAIVTLAFAGLAADALPAGSGILIPNIEGLVCKAMTFSSQKWPGVGTDAGVLLLRASLGRSGEEWALQRDDAELVALVRDELARLTGVTDMPIDSHVQRWGGALPQYAVGHLDRVTRIRSAVAAVPALAVCGASYDGVGIPACIASAHTAVDRVLAQDVGAAQ